MFRRLLAVSLLALAATSAHALDVTLEQTTKSPLGEVRFQSQGCDPQEKLPADFPRDVERTQIGRFSVWADPNDIRELYGQFAYVLYVRTPANHVERCTFSAASTGAFDDHHEGIHIAIQDAGATVAEGAIRLPIFGAASQAGLTFERPKDPQPVFMASKSVIRVAVKNDLPQMPLELVAAHAPTSDDPSLWNGMTARDLRPTPLAPQAIRFVEIEVAPNALQAFGNALIPTQEAQDDVLRFEVDYRIVGRGERPLTIEVPVRFRPRSSLLLVVTVIGALLGSLVPASQGTRKFREWWRAFSA
ncbi:MAG TPA: hypothetical protein VJZ00_11385, partial [Thermoanaerobaculia bacterium]|nr:hypothetical protein [Thermoanaerobaculia bacterium]